MRPGLGASFALVSQLGLTMVVSILIGLVAGQWIDARLGTSPWALVVLLLVGIAAGIFGVVRLVSRSIDVASSEPRPHATGRPSVEERDDDK
ncbi:MAG TPA: AtpZ/AtpI family protein [Chloroflexota bacterium]|nr:AtpZ/AtpI family protein [Chloroflexota bacterium]